MSSKFVDIDKVVEQANTFEKQLSELAPAAKAEAKKVIAEVEAQVQEANDVVFDFSAENRVREAGYTNSEAEDLAYIVKTKKIGQIFFFKNTAKIVTPFKTVVDAQVYLTALEDSLVSCHKEVDKFTNLSSLDLIKLSFNRFFKRGK